MRSSPSRAEPQEQAEYILGCPNGKEKKDVSRFSFLVRILTVWFYLNPHNEKRETRNEKRKTKKGGDLPATSQ